MIHPSRHNFEVHGGTSFPAGLYNFHMPIARVQHSFRGSRYASLIVQRQIHSHYVQTWLRSSASSSRQANLQHCNLGVRVVEPSPCDDTTAVRVIMFLSRVKHHPLLSVDELINQVMQGCERAD